MFPHGSKQFDTIKLHQQCFTVFQPKHFFFSLPNNQIRLINGKTNDTHSLCQTRFKPRMTLCYESLTAMLMVQQSKVVSFISASSSTRTSSLTQCGIVYLAAWRPTACLHQTYGLLTAASGHNKVCPVIVCAVSGSTAFT